MANAHATASVCVYESEMGSSRTPSSLAICFARPDSTTYGRPFDERFTSISLRANDGVRSRIFFMRAISTMSTPRPTAPSMGSDTAAASSTARTVSSFRAGIKTPLPYSTVTLFARLRG